MFNNHQHHRTLFRKLFTKTILPLGVFCAVFVLSMHLNTLTAQAAQVTVSMDANGGTFLYMDRETGEWVPSTKTQVTETVEEEDRHYVFDRGSYGEPRKSGKVFMGWNTKKDGTGTFYWEYLGNWSGDIDFPTDGSVKKLYAVWGERIDITLDANGGTFDDGETIHQVGVGFWTAPQPAVNTAVIGGGDGSEGDGTWTIVAVEGDQTPRRDGYSLAGWSPKKSVSKPVYSRYLSNNDREKLAKENKLYAYWYKLCTVTMHAGEPGSFGYKTTGGQQTYLRQINQRFFYDYFEKKADSPDHLWWPWSIDGTKVNVCWEGDGGALYGRRLEGFDPVETGTTSVYACWADKDISNYRVSIADQTYTGQKLTPEVKVMPPLWDVPLAEWRDYQVSYGNNVNTGTAEVIISGTGDFEGVIRTGFTIKKAKQLIKAAAAATSVEEGKTTTVEVTGVKGTVTFSSSDKTVATVDKNTGKVTAKKAGTVTITAKAAATSNYNAATAKVTIKVTAKKALPFKDVAKKDAYYDAVYWAYFAGIVKGKSTDIFAPGDNLTRGEFCTMLWRMFGKPEVTDAMVKALPFADAQASNHKKAITWCYRQKIITGYQDGTFKPSRSVSRGNILVMLFKLAKKQPGYTAPTIKNPFTDVKTTNSGYPAYRWAYANGLTADRKLEPAKACTRATMVTYLYGFNEVYHVKD